MTSKKNKLRAAKLLQRRYKKKPNPLNPEASTTSTTKT